VVFPFFGFGLVLTEPLPQLLVSGHRSGPRSAREDCFQDRSAVFCGVSVDQSHQRSGRSRGSVERFPPERAAIR
jgi:hypothetical protein